jgi:hypothetical protein
MAPDHNVAGTPATPSYTVLNASSCLGVERPSRRHRPRAADWTPITVAAGHFHYQWTAKVLAEGMQV